MIGVARPSRRSRRLLVAALLVVGCAGVAGSSFTREIDERIRFYTEQTERYPRSWPLYVQLASAHLAKARLTHDHVWLEKCSEALAASMAIQPGFEAFKLKARALQHAHRFEEAIAWVRRAQEAAAPAVDPEVRALLVLSYVGLGRYADAGRLLPPPGTPADDLHTAGARGRWLASQRRWDEAAAAYVETARLAGAVHSSELVVWAEISAAGVFIDSGRFEQARPHLESARRLAPDDVEVRLHTAELHEGQGRAENALVIYAELATALRNASIHHMAFRTARALGCEAETSRHFHAAETGYRAVLDAGEVYTLEALARLYADAEVHLERALELAERNLGYKRDEDARATLAYVRDQRSPVPSENPALRCSCGATLVTMVQSPDLWKCDDLPEFALVHRSRLGRILLRL